MPDSKRGVMANMLKVPAIKFSTPMAVLIIIKPYNLTFHKIFQRGERYARIMMSSILNLVAALTA
jgi:hypothetical protein